MQLDWTRTEAGAATLVTARLRNETGLDRRVRLRNRLPGPALPPRREGVPEPGWDREGVTVDVAAGETAAVGYACPVGGEAEGSGGGSPPVAIDAVESPDGPVEGGDGDGTDAGVDRAVRNLGDPRPPRAVLGRAGPERAEPTRGASDDADETDAGYDAHGNDASDDDPPEPDGSEIGALPPPVATWLDAVRDRVEAAEALDGASVAEAATILASNEESSDLDSVAGAPSTDERRLRAVAAAATRLADRVADAEPPVDALRRLS